MPDEKSAQLREQSRRLDSLYKETDRLYTRFAQSCGLSNCAYWIMYDIEVGAGSASVRSVTENYSYSKQTMSSALRSLEAKGLVELSFEPGSRKNKVVSFTPAGAAFSAERVVPAIEAETRAFGSLAPEERDALVCLVERYARAVHDQLDLLKDSERGEK